jgi:hypothetical protein
MLKTIKKSVLPVICFLCAITGYMLIEKPVNENKNNYSIADTSDTNNNSTCKQSAKVDSGAIPYGLLMLPAVFDSSDTLTLLLGIYASEIAAQIASEIFAGTRYKTSILKVIERSGIARFILTAGKYSSIENAELELDILQSEYQVKCRIVRFPSITK